MTQQPGTPYDQLTPAQQAQAAQQFADDMRHNLNCYTYCVKPDGTLAGWRFWIPSALCAAMIEHVMKGQ